MKKLSFIYFVGFFALIQSLFWVPAISAHLVVTIKPLHSVVSQMAKDTNIHVELLLKENISPHDFHLKPSHMLLIQKTDMVIYIDDHFETFLPKALEKLSPNQHILRASDIMLDQLLPLRGKHHHEHTGNCCPDGEWDFHFWLDPQKMLYFSQAVYEKLAQKYPEYQVVLQKNMEEMQSNLLQLDLRLKQKTKSLQAMNFIVFHDAYQYFEKAYGLHMIGVVMPKAGISPSARHIRKLRRKIRREQVKCILSEPQFSNQWVEKLAADMKLYAGEIDPLGANIPAGESHYPQMIEAIADGLLACEQ